MTPAELQAIKKREARATPMSQLGLYRYSCGHGRLASPADWMMPEFSARPNQIADFYSEADREFYFHARADIPALLAALEASEAKRRR